MSSSKVPPEDYKSPILARSRYEDMVTPPQLSVTDSLLNHASIFCNATSLPSANNQTINPTSTKTNLALELENHENSNRIFTFEGFFDMEDDLRTANSFSPSTSSEKVSGTTSPYYQSPRTIQPVLLTTLSTPAATPPSEGLPSPVLPHTPEENNAKKKVTVGRKRKAESLEEKEARARERVLRNRHAAQMSRDKKRRQLADLEAQNAILKEENSHLSKRIKLVEEENASLSAKFETISAQLTEIQSQLAMSEVTKFLLDGVRGSAASATLESNSLASDDGKEEQIAISSISNEKILLHHPSRSIDFAQEYSKKSQQRPIKMRNLYGTSTFQMPSFLIWMLPPHILKTLLTFSIVFSTMSGGATQFPNRMESFLNNVGAVTSQKSVKLILQDWKPP